MVLYRRAFSGSVSPVRYRVTLALCGFSDRCNTPPGALEAGGPSAERSKFFGALSLLKDGVFFAPLIFAPKSPGKSSFMLALQAWIHSFRFLSEKHGKASSKLDL